jgi:hypothetical protein
MCNVGIPKTIQGIPFLFIDFVEFYHTHPKFRPNFNSLYNVLEFAKPLLIHLVENPLHIKWELPPRAS